MRKMNSQPPAIEIREDILEDFPPEPSRPPAIPIDAEIDAEDGYLLQYVQEMGKWNDSFFKIVSKILKRIYPVYDLSKRHGAVRSAVLAFAGADLLFNGESRYER
jgi:hypothetical protein